MQANLAFMLYIVDVNKITTISKRSHCRKCLFFSVFLLFNPSIKLTSCLKEILMFHEGYDGW